jgi:hypothetical protein
MTFCLKISNSDRRQNSEIYQTDDGIFRQREPQIRILRPKLPLGFSSFLKFAQFWFLEWFNFAIFFRQSLFQKDKKIDFGYRHQNRKILQDLTDKYLIWQQKNSIDVVLSFISAFLSSLNV